MRWGPDGPPDEAYERVTNPERFAVLHERGDALVASLVARYGAGVSSTELPGCVRAVRVVPPVGGPLTLGWTDFPGLRSRAGHGAVSSAPHWSRRSARMLLIAPRAGMPGRLGPPESVFRLRLRA